jgi:nitrite reductase/ring-hydroxylating ferredoxin subunit
MDDTIRVMAGPDEWRCAVATVPPGHSAVFRLERAGRAVNGFVVNHDGHFRAYINCCPHVGTPLDLWPNEFFDEDGRALICSTHGAVFEPISGRCTAGPCVGDRLTPLPLALEGETLVVRLPTAAAGPQ